MIIMHGLFDLNDDVNKADFRQDFDQFSEHLKANDLIRSYRFMQHQEHDGYNADAPETKFYVSVEFVDMDYAQRCWDYIEEESEPLRSLHTRVFSKVRNSRFFLSTDV